MINSEHIALFEKYKKEYLSKMAELEKNFNKSVKSIIKKIETRKISDLRSDLKKVVQKK